MWWSMWLVVDAHNHHVFTPFLWTTTSATPASPLTASV